MQQAKTAICESVGSSLAKIQKKQSRCCRANYCAGVVFVGHLRRFLAPYPAFPNPKSLTPFYDGNVRTAPNSKYLFGTDVLGTDVFSDVLHGTKFALYVGVVVTLITMAIAIVVGAVAGFFGGMG